MQAAAQRLEDRKAAFKAGPDGTRKRDEHQSIIRKDKRNKLLGQRRGGGETRDPNILAGVAQYNKDALLAGNPQQLILLGQLLQHATQAQAEEYLPRLLWDNNGSVPLVLQFLVSQCFFNEVALRAVVNATHHVTNHDAAIIHAILSAGFLDGMAKTIMGKQFSSSAQHALLWEVVINITLSCREGHSIIMKQCCPQGALPFMEVLRFASHNHDAALQSAMVHLIYGLLRPGQVFPEIPLAWFQSIYSHLLLFVLADVQPMPHREMDAGQLATIGRAMDSLSQCILMVPDKETVLVPVMLEMGLDRIFRHLASLCAVQSDKNQVAILLLLGRMSLFNVQGNPFHESAHRCGIYRLMVANAARPDSVAARAHAFLSFGNYLADHYKSVGYMMGAGAMSVLLDAIRREHYAVRRQALFAVRSMILICDETRRNDMLYSDEASAIMKSLMKQHKLLDPVVPFISGEDIESARDAVEILATALRWDKNCVMDSMAGQEAEDRIQLLLPQLKSLQVGTEFYNLICEVEMLMDTAVSAISAMEEDPKEDLSFLCTNDGKPFYF
jgi:hypothetical protein